MTFADELRHAASVEPVGVNGNRIPRPRVPPVAEVLDLDKGFDRLLAMCRAKGVFQRPFWAAMQPPQGGDEAQLRWYVTATCPDPAQAALWTQGTFCFLLARRAPRVCHYVLTVGLVTPIAEADRQAARQALWDIGIREIRATYPRDNPHTQSVERLGFAVEERERYLHAVKPLVERP